MSAAVLLLLASASGLLASPTRPVDDLSSAVLQGDVVDLPTDVEGFTETSTGQPFISQRVPKGRNDDADEDAINTLLSDPDILKVIIESGKQFVNSTEQDDNTLDGYDTTAIGRIYGQANDTEDVFQQKVTEVLRDVVHKMKLFFSKKKEGSEDWTFEEGGGLVTSSALRFERAAAGKDTDRNLPARTINDIVELFIVLAVASLEERGLDEVAIPNMERKISQDIGIATLRGTFRGRKGWVRRLTTLKRTGPVHLECSGDGRSVSLSVAMGLKELEVGFKYYELDMRAFPTVSGRLRADVKDNTVRLNITFAKKQDGSKACDITLQNLKVERLNGIKLEMTGLGPLNWLLSRIATWMTKHSLEKVSRVVEKELIAVINNELHRIPCDVDFIDAIRLL